ncbi:MAG: hypothetical protein AAAC47_29625, partial [Pararhizobium sp.]
MHGDDHWWDLRSILPASSVARWLAVGGKARPRKATHERGDHQQRSPAAQVAHRTEHVTLVAPTIDNEHSRGQRGDVISAASGQVDVDHASLSLVGATAAARGAMVQNAGSFRTASLLSAFDRGIGRTGVDLSGPSPAQGSAPAAVVRMTPAAAEPAKSTILIIHEAGPSAKLIAEIARSPEPTAYLGIDLPYGICGCGYFTSLTQLLNQAPGSVLQADGQLPGTRFTSGPDYVPGGGDFGSSISDPLLQRNLTPMADWDWQLPGGGETGTGTMTGQIGILSGSVKGAV